MVIVEVAVDINVFVAGVTEYERGWGNRPDGYVIVRTPDDLKTLLKPNGHLCGDYEEFSTVATDLRAAKLTEEGVAAMEGKVALWVMQHDKRKLIE